MSCILQYAARVGAAKSCKSHTSESGSGRISAKSCVLEGAVVKKATSGRIRVKVVSFRRRFNKESYVWQDPCQSRVF